MRITAEFKDLDEFLAFVKAKGIDEAKGIDVVEVHAENGPALDATTTASDPRKVQTVLTAKPEATAGFNGDPNRVTGAAPEELETPPQPAPAEEPTYSLDGLQRAAFALVNENKSLRPRLAEMLKECGVKSMRELPTSAYASFAEGLRSLGAAV